MAKNPSSVPFTRRQFIEAIMCAGGAAAGFAALDALGATALAVGEAHRYAGSPKLGAGIGKGRRVTILGAGIAGLTSAYELSKAGFDCAVIEARQRAGGRNWTIRGGDTIVQHDGTQRAAWPTAPHLYFNAGPARIPHHHHAVLGYCRELGVPLEIMMNDNRAALLQDDAAFNGKPQEARRVINDTRGHLGELLAKAFSSGALDREMTREDRERLMEVIAGFGDLQRDGRYLGSERAGYIEPPGEGLDFGRIREPLPLKELARADFWQFKASFGEGFDQASTMLQPVGGMDRIPLAFTRRIGRLIRYGQEVTQIRKTARGARVMLRTAGSRGPETAIDSDFVICTLPLSVLRKVPNDFSAAFQKAIGEAAYATPGKIAFYTPRRFWEEDSDIYGGMSWTNREITQILYPSHGLRQKDGVLVGSYTFGLFPGDDVSKMPVNTRIENAIVSGERLHPGYRKEVRAGISISWPNVPFNDGGWAQWTPEQKSGAYRTLLAPDGPLLLAGEHLANLMSWQEGAILSAHRAITQIARRIQS